MQVLKFGGSSVANAERINQMAEILKTQTAPFAVVVSALGGITDQLILAANQAKENNKEYLKTFQEIQARHFQTTEELLKKSAQKSAKAKKMLEQNFSELEDLLHGVYLIKELSNRTLDLIMSFGERLSAFIVSQYLPNAEFLDARQLVKTDESFGYAKVDFRQTYENIKKHFQTNKKLQIITGFIGSTSNNETTTLGRGGSDYTAAIFGAGLDAAEIQIWTDVDGIMTADPRKVKKAFSIPQVSYEEAMEMSHFGAKVIHPPTMQPALNKNIPIRIKNTMNPAFEGSVISGQTNHYDLPVKGISSINNITLLTLQGSGLIGVAGISARLFGALARKNISVILISQASSEHSICFAIDPNQATAAQKAMEEEFSLEMHNQQIDRVLVEKDLSILAIVGQNMKNSHGLSGKIFETLGQNGINVIAIAQGSSELNVSVVIGQSDELKALNAIHDSLFLSKTKSLNLFLVGTGLIGKTLLKQLNDQCESIKKNQTLEINLIGFSNSKKMVLQTAGTSFYEWEKVLKNSKVKADLKNFVNEMISLNLPNSVFVDCTSSEEVAEYYPQILKSSISIVTPNKKANSSNLKDYLKLSHAAAKSNAKFLYETNVGAGLPIIKTLQDLLFSGDKVEEIEAVLSGTLSYIFNSFQDDKKFSEIVKEAKEKGYTEPDPRDDLNGLDVARKLLILARENGLLLDLHDIEVENLIPENCRQASTVDQFFKELEKNNDYFERLKIDATAKNQKLCYIASLKGKKAKIKLQAIDPSHPFYSLSGSDNIIAFKTARYSETPLVIKGPGAGAEVTAAGVFADLLRVANITFNTKLMRYAFAEKLKKKNLAISLIGMSNIGKTTWAKKLTKAGFKHINCDDLIEKKLEPVLKERGFKGIHDVAKWLGQPYDKQFQDNQQQYLDLENQTMEEVLQKLEKEQENLILDTTGSVIYTNEENLKKLKKHTIVVYLKASPEMKQEMLKHYLAHPKPVIWGETFQKSSTETDQEALARCYENLLEERSKLYEAQADLVIPYHKANAEQIDEEQFLSLIQENL